MAKSFYIIDGHYQIYRAFYAPFRDLSSPAGEPTRATYVFCQVLFGLLRDRRPDYVAMVLDAGDETTFRRQLDENYKAQREPTPEALDVQARRIVSIVETAGIPTFIKEGFEADDLMATIADKLKAEEVEVFLVSRDKDLEQLITDRVQLYDAAKSEVVDAKKLLDVKGYTPDKAVEIQILTGDSTDNIPGVPGIGVKTAAKLIAQYGSAEAVVAHADELTPKMRDRVKAFAPQLERTRKLVTLRRDAPLMFSLDECSAERLDFSAIRPIFEELGFRRLLDPLNAFTRDDGGNENPRSRAQTATIDHGRYELIDGLEHLDAFVARLGAEKVFAMDTETTGLNPVEADLVGLSFSWKAGEAYYVPVRSAIGQALPVDVAIGKLKPILEDPAIAKVGQNIKYDMLALRQLGVEVAGVSFDTMIAAFLLDPLAPSRSLDYLAKAHLGYGKIPITDLIGKGKQQITLDQVSPGLVCQYACEDADVTWRLYELLAPRMAESHVGPLFRETEIPLVSVLAEMEHNGIALDTTLLAELGRTMAARMDELKQQVFDAAGHEFNIDSTRQLAVVLFDEQGLSVVRQTKTGRSTDAATLQALAARTKNPIPGLVLEYRELAKLRGTYVETLPKMICRRTGRVHASFDQTGAVTGRLSSSDPNLQNIPVRTETGRHIRRAFVAGAPDHVLLTADYSQIELRLLAHFCQDLALIEAFRSGQDIHRTVAAQVNGVPLDEVTPAQRSAAKAVNFGIIYGQSAFGLSRALGISTTEARTFIDAYFDRYPGIRAFIDRCIKQARDSGYAETILGRRRPIAELHSRNRQQVSLGERIAVNTVVQGSAAELIKKAMIDIHRAYKTGELSARMLIQVHDELVFEVSESRVTQDAGLIRDKMQTAMPLDVPIVADVAWGRTWADSK